MLNPIAVSTWSIHRILGLIYQNGPNSTDPERISLEFGAGTCSLIDLPAELARRGFNRVEICHFHIASRTPEYLSRLRAAFAAHGIAIQTLLIDDGDVTDPALRIRDMAWIATWIESAAILGAENARVIAGKCSPSRESLELAVSGLAALGRLGKERGVRIVTENWFDLLAGPAEVHLVLDALGGDIGFLADTGNWSGPDKYENLKSVFARSELCHSKCAFDGNDAMDATDYGLCLQAAAAAGYTGPHTLIYEGGGDEWRGVEREREFVRAFAS